MELQSLIDSTVVLTFHHCTLEMVERVGDEEMDYIL